VGRTQSISGSVNPFLTAMLEVNLFPLLISPDSLRIYRYGHQAPQKLLAYLRALPELAYLHAHPGHPGWPKALSVEVVQGNLRLEEAVTQAYWLTKVAGGLYHPGALPLSVADPEPTGLGKGKAFGEKRYP
jgi:hypothetical protein